MLGDLSYYIYCPRSNATFDLFSPVVYLHQLRNLCSIQNKTTSFFFFSNQTLQLFVLFYRAITHWTKSTTEKPTNSSPNRKRKPSESRLLLTRSTSGKTRAEEEQDVIFLSEDPDDLRAMYVQTRCVFLKARISRLDLVTGVDLNFTQLRCKI